MNPGAIVLPNRLQRPVVRAAIHVPGRDHVHGHLAGREVGAEQRRGGSSLPASSSTSSIGSPA